MRAASSVGKLPFVLILRTLPATLQAAGLNDLGEMHLRADPLELLDQEPPTGRRLQRNLETLPLERHMTAFGESRG